MVFDKEYPGTAVQRLNSVHERVKSLTPDQLNGDWSSVRRKLLWAGRHQCFSCHICNWRIPVIVALAYKNLLQNLSKVSVSLSTNIEGQSDGLPAGTVK
jgi:hypothetical protein